MLIKNCLILPMDRPSGEALYFRGSIGVCGRGIEMVCALSDSDYTERVDEFCTKHSHDKEFRVIDGSSLLAMPGLINIHNHVSMTLMRSYADDMALMPWLTEKIWPFEAQMVREDVYLGAKLGIAEMLLGGTTTFVDMYWWQEAVAEAAIEAGIRVVLSPTMIDMKVDDFRKDMSVVAAKYADAQNPLVDMMVATHAPYTCSTEHLTEAGALCEKYGVGLNIHLAESNDEADIIMDRYGKSPVEYMDSIGLLNDRTLAVHCVHLSDSDIETLSRRKVSVAHNPQSNMKLGSGISPVAKMVAAGVNVGIGTDGTCSNNDLDMWEEMRSAAFLQKVSTGDPCVLPAYEVLKMATVNGAKAIGRGDDLGTIAEGRTADIILIDIEKPHLYPRNDMVANLVYCAKSSDVDTVIIDGKIVVSNRKVLTLNTPKLCQEVEQRSKELIQTASK